MSPRSMLVSVGVAGALAAGAFGVAIPALAASPVPAATCSGNLTCTYADANYVTFLGSRSPGTGLADISLANRNKLSSWINYTSTSARFYYNTGGGGTCVTMSARNRNTVTPGVYNPDNDQAESWGFNRGC